MIGDKSQTPSRCDYQASQLRFPPCASDMNPNLQVGIVFDIVITKVMVEYIVLVLPFSRKYRSRKSRFCFCKFCSHVNWCNSEVYVFYTKFIAAALARKNRELHYGEKIYVVSRMVLLAAIAGDGYIVSSKSASNEYNIEFRCC
ncbi:hypothetical protein CASFOL_023158 [Castilleja foliolosa]|uniref:Uncharacterized protein n=1 Tax=Castilleja foliolosa TaxID=1961234 RepID=A0ABD3CLP2_9LAMI